MMWRAWSVMAAVTALDQASKLAVVRCYPHQGSGRVLIPYIANLLHVRNTGAAWGMMQGRQPILIACAVAALVWLAIKMRGTFMPLKWGWLAWGLLAGGIAGNLVDRAWRGFVVDFIDPAFVRFPTFNIADAAISLGVAMLILTQWLSERAAKRGTPAACRESAT